MSIEQTMSKMRTKAEDMGKSIEANELTERGKIGKASGHLPRNRFAASPIIIKEYPMLMKSMRHAGIHQEERVTRMTTNADRSCEHTH